MDKAANGRWAVAAMFLVNGFMMGAWAPQIPLMLPRLGIGSAVMGLLILMIGAGAVGAMLFAGKLIAAHGSRRMVLVFAALFLPYWEAGKDGIVKNVLLYSSYPVDYGLSTFFRADWLKWLFVAGLFIYPLAVRTADLTQRLLLSALFFLVFTTGFGNQYQIGRAHV